MFETQDQRSILNKRELSVIINYLWAPSIADHPGYTKDLDPLSADKLYYTSRTEYICHHFLLYENITCTLLRRRITAIKPLPSYTLPCVNTNNNNNFDNKNNNNNINSRKETLHRTTKLKITNKTFLQQNWSF